MEQSVAKRVKTRLVTSPPTCWVGSRSFRTAQGPVSWRPTTVKWRQFSQSNRHSTIGTRQTQYHVTLPSSANVQSHLTSSFADDGNASWYSVCRVPMMEWRLDCENCRHLTVVGLHDTGPWTALSIESTAALSSLGRDNSVYCFTFYLVFARLGIICLPFICKSWLSVCC